MKYLILAILLLVVTSCAQQIDVNQCIEVQKDGFFSGFIHGLILPISLIVSWFDSDVAIYAINNNGAWYDLGFYFGVAATLGGGSTVKERYF